MSQLILIVDDDQDVLELIATLLEEEGYQVVTRSARMDYAETIRAVKPDLLIIDQMFGGNFTGWQLIQKMKLSQDLVDLPIIICTAAWQMVRKIETQLNIENIQVIQKPFDLEDLTKAVRVALEPHP